MNFCIIRPTQQLADFVRFFWFSEASASIEKPYVHHAFAYPCPELIFCYKGAFSFSTRLGAERTLAPGFYGQTETFSKASSNADFGIFGVYLYPHALPQLFRLPATELTNQYADVRSLLGKDGDMLEEKIMLAADNHQRVKLVSDFLRARLKNVRTEYAGIASSIKLISGAFHATSVKALAGNSYLSLRQFERRFKELSGFNPKLFLRIARFNSMLNKPFRQKSLTQLAYEFDYHDQSHFIHDFQQFSGNSPKAYFNEEAIAASDRGTIEF